MLVGTARPTVWEIEIERCAPRRGARRAGREARAITWKRVRQGKKKMARDEMTALLVVLLASTHAAARTGTDGDAMTKEMVPEAIHDLEMPRVLPIHVPKTGGSAIESWGTAHGFKWGPMRPWPQSTTMKCPGWHVPRGVYTQLDGNDPYHGSTTVCVVRHPFTRAVSDYLYHAQLAIGCARGQEPCEEPNAATTICNATSLNTWILAKIASVGSAVRRIPYHGRLLEFDADDKERLRGCHWLPQWMYVGSPGQGKMCDRTLHYEHLDEQWTQFIADVYPTGRDHALSSFTRNKPICSMQIADLSSEARRGLHDLYARDFELFGYSPETSHGERRQTVTALHTSSRQASGSGTGFSLAIHEETAIHAVLD